MIELENFCTTQATPENVDQKHHTNHQTFPSLICHQPVVIHKKLNEN